MKHALLILCVVGAGCGGSSPTAPSQPTTRTFALSGTVSDRGTGAPLTGATVTVVDGPNANRSATTDGSGAYRLADLTASGFTLRVTRAGYDNAVAGITVTSDTVLPVAMDRTPVSLAGAWGGAFAFSLDGTAFTRGMVVDIVQNGRQIDGTYTAGGTGLRGTFSATMSTPYDDALLTGTITLDTPATPPSPIRCIGSGALTGTVSPAVLRSNVILVSNCQGAVTGITLTLTRAAAAGQPAVE